MIWGRSARTEFSPTAKEEEAQARKFVLGKLYNYIDRLSRDTRVRWVRVQSADSVSSGGKLCTIIVCLDKGRTHRRLWFDDKEMRWRWDGRRSGRRGGRRRGLTDSGIRTGRTNTSVPNLSNPPVQQVLSFGFIPNLNALYALQPSHRLSE